MLSIIPVSQLNIPELDPYARLNEPQLKHYLEPDTGLFIAETLNVAERALAAGYRPVSFLTEERFIPQVTRLLEMYSSDSDDICLYTAPLDVSRHWPAGR